MGGRVSFYQVLPILLLNHQLAIKIRLCLAAKHGVLGRLFNQLISGIFAILKAFTNPRVDGGYFFAMSLVVHLIGFKIKRCVL